MTSKRVIGFITLTLSLAASGAVQAKSHLSRDELKVLSATSVAVVYLDSDRALWPFIKQHAGTTVATMMLADALDQRQFGAFNARTAPYQGVLDELSLPQSTRKAMQEALASIVPLQQTPWTIVTPDLQDHSIFREQGLKTKADVVVFIRPRLELNDDADDLYLVTMIDIETLDATGKSLNHYENTELVTDIDVDDDALPLRTTPPKPDATKEDMRAAGLFANDGQEFKALYAKLVKQAQQQIYYYFTGNDTPPPAATTHVSGI